MNSPFNQAQIASYGYSRMSSSTHVVPNRTVFKIHYYKPSAAATVSALVFWVLKAFMGVNVLLGLFWTASILATSPAFSLWTGVF
jgi:hypothetical protein